jgi:hypothetical protein
VRVGLRSSRRPSIPGRRTSACTAPRRGARVAVDLRAPDVRRPRAALPATGRARPPRRRPTSRCSGPRPPSPS